jgi:hypothetical protein
VIYEILEKKKSILYGPFKLHTKIEQASENNLENSQRRTNKNATMFLRQSDISWFGLNERETSKLHERN